MADQPKDSPKDVSEQAGDLRKTSAKVAETTRAVAKSQEKVAQSAKVQETSALRQEDSADRRTELASDRTVYAAERTYAAWMRSGLGSLAAGVGARALLHEHIAEWLAAATSVVLVLFASFCFLAAVWRELDMARPSPHPDIRTLPGWILIAFSAFLILVSIAVLIGLWTS